jgi:hypothetical protein
MKIPPYQDIATLTENLCISERTVDVWVKQGLLPPPVTRGTSDFGNGARSSNIWTGLAWLGRKPS